MDTLYGLLADISKDLVCKGFNQLQYSFCFNEFVKEVEEEENNLTETRENVERRVTHAQRQNIKIDEVIDKWLENAKSDSKDVDCLLKDAKAKKSCCLGYCPNWIWRYRLGKKLANKKAELEKIIQKGRPYMQLERIASIPSNTFDILTEKSMNFESRKYAYDQVMKALKYDGVGIIGLYGMGGCGKTTLAMEVKKIAEAEHLFDKVIFVPVSNTVEIPRIQEKIASSLQYTFPENQEMERAQRLCMRLTQEKNILIILDDVWEKLDFGRIGIPSSEHHKGCKILITTRSEEVCTLMDCQKTINLPILTDEEAWVLFQNKAVISKDTPKTITDLARSISNECKGLPVAIVAVASSLKEKQKDIWRSALNKLRSSKQINIGKGLQDPYKCLQLSYDNLDTEEAKSLLLLCSAFPEDYEIPIEGLIRCAIGLGVVDGFDTYEEARTEVTATKIKLVSSCLLLDVGDKHVKMHDLVRDVAQWIAKNENKAIKCELEKDVTLDHGLMRYLWCVKFPNDIDCSNLEFLSIQTKLEVSDAIFEKMEKLRVLILSNQNDNNGLQLSTMSFKTLQNLRCLVLQYWKLSDISFVRDMKKLQSLSLRRCSLPSFLELETDVGVTQLPNLKLLEFSHCDIERRNFEEIKLIRSLEELYILENYWNGNVEFLNVLPETLKRYGIVLGYNTLYYYSPQLEFCSFHATLALYHFDISNEIIMRMAKSSKELTMGNIEGGAKNIVPDIFQIGASMSELNQLKIQSSEIECLIDTSNHLNKVGNLFSELCSLTIAYMQCLRALWHGCVPVDGSFEKLEILSIEYCPKLTSLFTYDMARGLVHLKSLKIYCCDILKHIVTNDDKTMKSEDEFAIGHFEHSKIFQNLEDLEVTYCRELKDVFSAGIIGGLPQLKSLGIQECNMLEQIIGDVVPSAHQDEKEAKDEIIEENEHQHFESNQLIFSSKSTSTPSPPIVNHSSGTFSIYIS